MADWTDGSEYAPVERPGGFASPRVAPLEAPAGASVVEAPRPDDHAPAAFEQPEAPALESLVPRSTSRRDPHEAFTEVGDISSGWGAAHSTWRPTMPLGEVPEPAAANFPPPSGAPVVAAPTVDTPGPAPTPQQLAGFPPPAGPSVALPPPGPTGQQWPAQPGGPGQSGGLRSLPPQQPRVPGASGSQPVQGWGAAPFPSQGQAGPGQPMPPQQPPAPFPAPQGGPVGGQQFGGQQVMGQGQQSPAPQFPAPQFPAPQAPGQQAPGQQLQPGQPWVPSQGTGQQGAPQWWAPGGQPERPAPSLGRACRDAGWPMLACLLLGVVLYPASFLMLLVASFLTGRVRAGASGIRRGYLVCCVLVVGDIVLQRVAGQVTGDTSLVGTLCCLGMLLWSPWCAWRDLRARQ